MSDRLITSQTIRVTHVLHDGRAFSHLHWSDGSAFYDSRPPWHPATTFRWESVVL
jgi:hypothetical protein